LKLLVVLTLVFLAGCYTGEVIRGSYLCSSVEKNNIQLKEEIFVFENGLKKKYVDFCEGDYLYVYSCIESGKEFSKLSDSLIKDKIYCNYGCFDGACLI